MMMYTIIIVSLIILYYLRKYLTCRACTSTRKLFGKTVIVTGSTAGIGKETARDVANRGARVILAVRNLEKAKEVIEDIIESTGNSDVKAMYLDLTSLESVTEFSREFKKKETRLDVLINNAGVAFQDSKETVDGFELTWQTNYLGHFLLTMLLVDVLKGSAPSRVVNVSSMAYDMIKGELDYSLTTFRPTKTSFFGTLKRYAQSKYAQLLFTKKLGELLKVHEVTVYSLHPGTVRTSIMDNLHFRGITYLIFCLVSQIILLVGGLNARQGSQTTICCAVQGGIEKYTGGYFSNCKHVKLAPNRLPQEQIEELWKRSLEMVKPFYVGGDM